MKSWSIIKYNGENYIILSHYKKNMITISKYHGEISEDGILSEIDNYYDDIINFIIRDDIPIMNIKENKIEGVIYEWG